MKNRLYAILPDAALEWERRRIQAIEHLKQAPKSELCESDREAITDYMDANREFIRQYLGMFFNQRREMKIVNGVAHIHINDFLGGDLTFIDRCMGASDYADISADIKAAISSPEVKSALLEVNSGGGSAGGCVEVGRLVAELNSAKVVYSFVERIGCSAAYAIACPAMQIFSPPSAMVGSVGTILTWYDYAAMLEEEGITPHVVTNEGADLKGIANPAMRPTSAQEEALQDFVNDYGAQFQFHVLQNRPRLPAEAFRGQALSGLESRKIGFVDGIATHEEVVAALEGIASLG